jgi:hypothetical protein
MRLTLDNQKSYNIAAMFRPKKLNRSEAWGNFRANLRAWPNALKIPFQYKLTIKGFSSWIAVFICFNLSLILLPLLCVFGYSTQAYAFFTRSDAEKLKQYKQDLQRIYAELSSIEDKDEYQRRLKEEIARVKPFNPL